MANDDSPEPTRRTLLKGTLASACLPVVLAACRNERSSKKDEKNGEEPAGVDLKSLSLKEKTLLVVGITAPLKLSQSARGDELLGRLGDVLSAEWGDKEAKIDSLLKQLDLQPERAQTGKIQLDKLSEENRETLQNVLVRTLRSRQVRSYLAGVPEYGECAGSRAYIEKVPSPAKP